MLERPIVSSLVYHKSNPEIYFIAYSFNREDFTYKCRHIPSNPESGKSVVEFTFHHFELEVVELQKYYRRWLEYEIVNHRTNKNLKMVALEETERGKTKCRWITTDLTGAISLHENIFEHFELIKVEDSV